MLSRSFAKTVFILDLAGVLFSGYLSGVKLFTSTCALSEPCPYFLGYPACWYGFAMFFTMFVTSLLGISNRISSKSVAIVHAIVSGVGILFAGSFTVPEIGRLVSGTSHYTLGLPTCAYGLIFYILIFVLSLRHIMHKNK